MNNRLSVFFLVFSLPVIVAIIVLSNMAGYENAEFWSIELNFVITSILLIACIVNNFKIGTGGQHGRAWLFFTLAIALWYIAERVWTISELTNSDSTFSYADLFWFSGYVFYFLFGVMFLKPFSSQISRKNILAASLSVVAVLIFIFYITMPASNISENILNASYPIADSFMLIPSILGIFLFFKGHIKFSWSLFFFGMLVFVGSDFGFMYFNSTGDYYDGHLIDIPYLYAYSIFIAGLIANLNLWNKTDKNKPFNEQDKLI
ncbi:conserved membrane hypothetical protein [metagenome]